MKLQTIIMWCGFSITLQCYSAEQQFHGILSDERPVRPLAAPADPQAAKTITVEELYIYLALIEHRRLQLETANESIMNDVKYSWSKIGAFITKGAIDGYCTATLLSGIKNLVLPASAIGGGAAVTTKSWTTKAVKTWLVNGGLEKLKGVGFDVGLVGLSSAANVALAKENHWEYHIPILGTAFVANTWSSNLMNAPELLEKNGNEIIALKKERFKIQRYLRGLETENKR